MQYFLRNKMNFHDRFPKFIIIIIRFFPVKDVSFVQDLTQDEENLLYMVSDALSLKSIRTKQ